MHPVAAVALARTSRSLTLELKAHSDQYLQWLRALDLHAHAGGTKAAETTIDVIDHFVQRALDGDTRGGLEHMMPDVHAAARQFCEFTGTGHRFYPVTAKQSAEYAVLTASLLIGMQRTKDALFKRLNELDQGDVRLVQQKRAEISPADPFASRDPHDVLDELNQVGKYEIRQWHEAEENSSDDDTAAYYEDEDGGRWPTLTWKMDSVTVSFMRCIQRVLRAALDNLPVQF